MAALPTGTVTFLFTDIEGSTTRWGQLSILTHGPFERVKQTPHVHQA